MPTLQPNQPVTSVVATPPAQPAPFPRFLRTIIHAGIAAVIMHALAIPLATRPLGATILSIASPAHFLPWSIGLSCGINNDRIIATVGSVIMIIYAFPDDLLATATPAIAGLFLGILIRALLFGARV